MQEFSSRNFYFSPGSFMGDCYRYKTKTRPKARHCLSTGGDGGIVSLLNNKGLR